MHWLCSAAQYLILLGVQCRHIKYGTLDEMKESRKEAASDGGRAAPIFVFLHSLYFCPKPAVVKHVMVPGKCAQTLQDCAALDPVQRPLAQWVLLVPAVHYFWTLQTQ